MSQSAKYALMTLRGPAPSRSCACAAVPGPATASPAPSKSAVTPASRRLLRNMLPPSVRIDTLTFAEPRLSVNSLYSFSGRRGFFRDDLVLRGASPAADRRPRRPDRVRSHVDRHVPAGVPGAGPGLPRDRGAGAADAHRVLRRAGARPVAVRPGQRRA